MDMLDYIQLYEDSDNDVVDEGIVDDIKDIAVDSVKDAAKGVKDFAVDKTNKVISNHRKKKEGDDHEYWNQRRKIQKHNRKIQRELLKAKDKKQRQELMSKMLSWGDVDGAYAS